MLQSHSLIWQLFYFSQGTFVVFLVIRADNSVFPWCLSTMLLLPQNSLQFESECTRHRLGKDVNPDIICQSGVYKLNFRYPLPDQSGVRSITFGDVVHLFLYNLVSPFWLLGGLAQKLLHLLQVVQPCFTKVK